MNRQHIFPQIVTRSWPLKRGKGRVVRYFSRGMSFDEDVALVRTTDGFDMHIIPGEHIGTHLYLTGEYERSVVSMLLKYAGQDDVLLDIGANVGYVSACFLHNVPRSKVFAVEPQPRIVDLLRANLRSFGPHRHEVFPVGISDADADGWLEMSSWNSGAAKVSAEQGDNSAAIQLWSAKTLFEATKGEKIDLVKIDVEGHVEIVLRGCESEFARLRPKAIVFENQTGTAAPTGSLGRIFNRLGYRVFGVRKHFTRLSLVPILRAQDCVYNDYVAER